MTQTPGNTLSGLVRMHGVEGALAKAEEFLAQANTKAKLQLWTTVRDHLLEMI